MVVHVIFRRVTLKGMKVKVQIHKFFKGTLSTPVIYRGVVCPSPGTASFQAFSMHFGNVSVTNGAKLALTTKLETHRSRGSVRPRDLTREVAVI